MDLLTRLWTETKGMRPGEGIWHQDAQETMRKGLRDAIPVRIQNVADYLWKETDQEDFRWDRDFPNIAPPWPNYFMWFKPPQTSRSLGKILPNPLAGFEALGYLHHVIEVPPSEGFRWSVNITLFQVGPAATVAQMIAYYVTADGAYFPAHRQTPDEQLSFIGSGYFLWPSGQEIPDPKNEHREITGIMTPVLLATSFCHCKNVAVKTERIPDKVVAKRVRQHGWSPTEIHELQIDPMRKALHEAGGADLKRALHIMRGHFKDYREGRGLFGKVHGVFWWPFQLKDSSHPHTYDIKPK